jgi:hypothetical protein
MAERMSTATRMDRNRADGIITRGKKSAAKRKERANREGRMIAAIKKGPFPYTPTVRSWISVKLGKPFRKIKEADAKKLAG